MKKFSTLFKNSVAFILFTLVSIHIYIAYASASGPGPGYANDPKASNCYGCHSNSKTKGIVKGKVTLTGITGAYTSSTTYHMVVGYPFSSATSSTHCYGFEITVLDSSTNKFIGKLAVTDKTNTQSGTFVSTGRTYIYHTSTGTKAASNKQWKFDWTSPASSTSTLAFYVTVNSANHSGDDAGDTIYAQVFYYKPAPPLIPGFKFSPVSVCAGSSVSFTDTTKGGPTSWFWTFKDGTTTDTTSVQNPSYAFSNSGTDSAILTVKNATQTKTIRKAITVNALPTATITAGSSAVCLGDSTLLTASGGTSYFWSNGANTSAIYVKDSVSYSVKVTNAGGCSAVSSAFKLKINPLPAMPTLSASGDSICSGQSLTLTAGSGYSDYDFMEGATSLANGSTNSFMTSKLSAGPHALTVTATNSAGCSSIASKSVSVYVVALPVMTLNYNAGGKYCSGDSVILKGSPSGLSKYNFYKNATVIYSGTNNSFIFPATSIKPGDNFSVEGFNASGCNATTSPVSLSYSPPLNPGFTFLDNKGVVKFTDTTMGTINKVTWDFGDHVSGDTNRNPIHTYKTKGIYSVQLVTFNANGCTDTFTGKIGIVLTSIEQPISFSGANVFPNPMLEELNMLINSVDEQKAEIILYDLKGHAVFSRKLQLSAGDNVLNMPLRGISNGNYILRLKGKEEIKEFRIIKTE